MKLLVLYVFHKYNERVAHFIENCIFSDENVDFIIISNGINEVNVHSDNVTTILRDNIGYDFGGWSDALLNDNLYEQYDNFIFVNSSVMGPYLSVVKKWTDIYIEGLNENVKLFGSTINTCMDPLNKSHVQSYIFSMDKTTVEYLIQCEIFSKTNYAITFQDAIWNKEVLMSRKIIENGWNIGSLLRCYKDVDFRFKHKPECAIPPMDDLMFPWFRNKIWTEYEIVFIKGNRVTI